MNNKSLIELCLENNYDTDKYDLGYINEIYGNTFPKYRSNATNLLEIGVQRGGSILLWKDYFDEKCSIFTLDINPCSAISELEGVTQLIGDAYKAQSLSLFEENQFDIIIDDGPHTLESFEYVISKYFSKLKPRGVMIVEDIIDISWTPKLVEIAGSTGYSSVNVINMGGKQKSTNHLSLWSKGLDVLILTK
jgi:23S rRNA U2552 (ribose-2'-O)-methylase RlmE/FtsJ